DVYVLDLLFGENGPLRVTLVGPDCKVRSHEHEFKFAKRACIPPRALKGGIAFPSEFKPNEESRPYFHTRTLPPVVDLACFYVQRRNVDIRLWIESDSLACMPALTVAANYQHVTSLRYRYVPPPRMLETPDPDR